MMTARARVERERRTTQSPCHVGYVFGKAKICNLEVPICTEQHIFWLEVAIDDLHGVKVIEGERDLSGKEFGDGLRKALTPAQQRKEFTSWYEVHDLPRKKKREGPGKTDQPERRSRGEGGLASHVIKRHIPCIRWQNRQKCPRASRETDVGLVQAWRAQSWCARLASFGRASPC